MPKISKAAELERLKRVRDWHRKVLEETEKKIKNPSFKELFTKGKEKAKKAASTVKAAYTKHRPAKNPRFAVSLESQHGTKPVGIIEAPNFLAAYSAAKKEYGPDIDVDVMNPIRRYVVIKRKKA